MQAIAIQEKKRAAKYEQELINRSSNKKKKWEFDNQQQPDNRLEEYEKIIENQLFVIHKMKDEKKDTDRKFKELRDTLEKENNNFRICLR